MASFFFSKVHFLPRNIYNITRNLIQLLDRFVNHVIKFLFNQLLLPPLGSLGEDNHDDFFFSQCEKMIDVSGMPSQPKARFPMVRSKNTSPAKITIRLKTLREIIWKYPASSSGGR